MTRASQMHALRRTSPKGEPFAGVCTQCGQHGLTIEDAMKGYCQNVRNLTQEQSLMEVITEKLP